MTLDEACRVKNPHGMAYEYKMDKYIRHIGRENIRPHIPIKNPDLARAWLKDRHFNTTSLKLWQDAAGYAGYQDRQSATPYPARGPFARLLLSKKIDSFSMSEAISLLKYCAELEARDYLSGIMASWIDIDTGRTDGEDIEIWAVFEHCNRRPDSMNRYNIFDYDCVAVFQDENAASEFELKNNSRRVRKKITFRNCTPDHTRDNHDSHADHEKEDDSNGTET